MNNVSYQSGVGNPKLIRDALVVRQLVFQYEQGIPSHLDEDGADPDCFIVVIYDKDVPIGTGRLDIKGCQIARIAIVSNERGKGYSFRVLDELESYAQNQGLSFVKLTPHLDLLRYYGKRGYEELPNSRFVVAGQELTVMMKKLNNGQSRLLD